VALEKICGITQMPPDVRFRNLPYRESEDHSGQQEHAHNREREDTGRKTGPGSAGGRLACF
jgi:hypothetical protein